MRRIFLLLFLLGAAAACGGGGGSNGAQAVPPTTGHPASGSTNEAMKIFVPTAGTAPAAKHAQYIAPGTQSVRIRVYTVNGATPSPQPPDTIAQIGPTAPGCTSVSGGVSCTVIVSVPINPSVVLEILSYSSTDGSGSPLAQGFVSVDTTQPNITPPPVALGGVVGSLVVSPTATSPAVSSSGVQTFQFTVTAKDTSGNVIIPPGTYTPSIFFSASNDPNGAISFSPNPLAIPAANGTNTITLSYDPSKAFTGTSSITATANTVKTSLTFTPTGTGGGGFTAGYRIFEYSIPTANSNPWNITVGPDAASLWFTENATEKIAALFPSTCTQTSSPTCTIIEEPIPQTNGATQPTGIAVGANGTVWVGGANGAPAGHLWVVHAGACSSSTQTSMSCTMTAQPDPMQSPSYSQIRNSTVTNSSWGSIANTIEATISASQFGTGGLLQIAPNAQPTPYYFSQSANNAGSSIFGVSTNGFATDSALNEIDVLGCSDCGYLSWYPFQTGGKPQGIINASNGTMYVADAGNNQIVSFDPATCAVSQSPCTYTPFTIPTTNAQPTFLTVGPDGNIWFTEFGGNKIGILNVTTMAISEIPIPTAAAGPWDIAVGPDGNVWFTERNAGKIGVVVP